jgi:hypothetical protein
LKQTTPAAMAALLSGAVSDLPNGEQKPRIHCRVWLSESWRASTMAHEGTTGRPTSGPKASFTLWLVPRRGDTAAQLAAEEHSAERVNTARLRYEIAESQLRRAVAGERKWPLPEAHRSALVHAARLEELAARNEYLQALKIFSELVLHGEVSE